jgi:uncharacterized delta-60 repeat protein
MGGRRLGGLGGDVGGEGVLIVASGIAQGNPGDDDFGLVRLMPSGALDTTFSGDGKTRTDFRNGSDDEGVRLALQPDGRIVITGETRRSAGDEDFGFARYRANGALDHGFSADGKTTTDFAGGTDQAFGIAHQPDGRLVAAGRADSSAGEADFGLARYLGGA